jgi:hypothetical protein
MAKEMQHDEDLGDGCGGTGAVGCARPGANGGRQGGHKRDDTKAEDKKPKVDDKAYQEALKRIPDPKEKYDPWAVTKTPDADKKSSK